MVLGVLTHLLAGGAARPAAQPDLLAGAERVAAEAAGAALDRVAPDGVLVEGVPAGEAAAEARPDPEAVAQHRLREAVFAPFRGVGGRFGIAVKDLGSGRTVLWNETFPFQAASLYKLPVMYEVFKLREWGLLTFREELTIGAEDAAMDLGSLPWPIGTRITVGTAVERMVTISDNSSAFMLARKVGAWRVNEDAASLGMKQTYIRGNDLSTSAQDMLHFLELIAQGEAIDAPTSAEMVHLLARQQVRDRIPARLPPEATVANKTGNWEGATHDVAIVYAPRATFVLAFLSDGVTDQEGVYDAMAHAARNVYDLASDPTFDTQPSPPLPPAAVGSYAAAPRLPVATAVPTRPAVQPAPATRAPILAPAQPAAPAATTVPATAAPPASAPSRATSQPSGASQPSGTTPNAQATATPARREEPRPTRTPKPDNDAARTPTPAPAVKPAAPAILNPSNGGAPLSAPTAKPQ